MSDEEKDEKDEDREESRGERSTEPHSPRKEDTTNGRWIPQLMRVVPRPGGTGIPAEKIGEDLVEESLRKRWRKEERSKEQYFKGREILADREMSNRRAKEARKAMRKFGRI